MMIKGQLSLLMFLKWTQGQDIWSVIIITFTNIFNIAQGKFFTSLQKRSIIKKISLGGENPTAAAAAA